MAERLIVTAVPTGGVGIYDTFRGRFLPCGELDAECEREDEHWDWCSPEMAERYCTGWNRDPLGHAERRRREDQRDVDTCGLFHAANGWYGGRSTDTDLRAAIEVWRASGVAVEEGLSIQ